MHVASTKALDAVSSLEAAGGSVTRLHGPTLWGLEPVELHDRFWLSAGVQVVRLGHVQTLRDGAAFLLTDADTFTLFSVTPIIEQLARPHHRMLMLRVEDRQQRNYREQVLTDKAGRVIGIRRIYAVQDHRLRRFALTSDRGLAQTWQTTADLRRGWRTIRQLVPRPARPTVSIEGGLYDRGDQEQMVTFSQALVSACGRPDLLIAEIHEAQEGVWMHDREPIPPQVRLLSPVWIGAGRKLEPGMSVTGPAIVWDAPDARPKPPHMPMPTAALTGTIDVVTPGRRQRAKQVMGKRVFDIVFACAAILLTLPIYPLIMLAIWLEDGWPFFFAHRRETVGGREFGCLKFRSMQKNAEQIKSQLVARNRADGPQFFIQHDPRLTRVGRFLRDTNLDEIPQFWNVLLGHMSVIGPRPSPRKENQFCPPWREARLSVRPGIAGLWQIKRSRSEGLDFQEWIRFDIEYLEKRSWSLDLWIIWRTVLLLLSYPLRALRPCPSR